MCVVRDVLLGVCVCGEICDIEYACRMCGERCAIGCAEGCDSVCGERCVWEMSVVRDVILGVCVVRDVIFAVCVWGEMQCMLNVCGDRCEMG